MSPARSAPSPDVADVAGVVIIGAGFAGLATAYFLGRAGVRDVVVLEREVLPGMHASGRNAALGRQLAEDDEATTLTIRGAAFLRYPPAGFAAGALLEPTGSMLVATEATTLAALIARARRHELACETLSPADLWRGWPLLEGMPALGAASFPTDGVIDIHALLEGYLRGARTTGARIWCGCEVSGLEPDGDGVSLATARGRLRARCAVIAAGAWAGALGARSGVDDPGLQPFRRHLFVTARQPEITSRAPFVWHEDDPFYVRPESGGLLISGCDTEPHPPTPPVADPVAAESLAHRLATLAPRLADLPIIRSWACLRTFTASGRPLIGWDTSQPRLFWVAGLGGHGATASAAVGELAAARLLERLPTL